MVVSVAIRSPAWVPRGNSGRDAARMAGNPFYGRGAFDERMRFAEAVAADRSTRTRMLKYAILLAPVVIAAYQQFQARHIRTDERA